MKNSNENETKRKRTRNETKPHGVQINAVRVTYFSVRTNNPAKVSLIIPGGTKNINKNAKQKNQNFKTHQHLQTRKQKRTANNIKKQHKKRQKTSKQTTNYKK